jgi:D-psicose/D-tagatose/L-ribulose 3-epimerase
MPGQRLKFGTHCFVLVDRWSDQCLPILDQARDLGLDCLEIAVGDDVHFTPQTTQQRAVGLGLDLIISPGALWPLECDLSHRNAENRRMALAWHKKQVDLAGELGAVAYTGALYGHPGVVRRRRPQPEESRYTVEGLYHLAEYAHQAGVILVAEPMSHFRTHIVNTPAQALKLIRQVGHPNLKILLDTYHLITEIRDYGVGINLVSEHLWGLHACENDRGVPGGGLVPWDAIFKALLDIQFAGYVLMETYNSSLGDFAFERGMFHNVCPDGPAFIRQGLTFLKQGLQKGVKA